jgi:hypothetical protein
MGAAIYPAILRDIFLQQNAVIGPQVADIVLQQHNGSARRGEAILPDGRSNLSAILRDIFLQQNAVIGPQVADIVLPDGRSNGSAAPRSGCTNPT